MAAPVLAKVDEYKTRDGLTSYELVVAPTHSHRDHVGGDRFFAGHPGVTLVKYAPEDVATLSFPFRATRLHTSSEPRDPPAGVSPCPRRGGHLRSPCPAQTCREATPPRAGSACAHDPPASEGEPCSDSRNAWGGVSALALVYVFRFAIRRIRFDRGLKNVCGRVLYGAGRLGFRFFSGGTCARPRTAITSLLTSDDDDESLAVAVSGSLRLGAVLLVSVDLSVDRVTVGLPPSADWNDEKSVRSPPGIVIGFWSAAHAMHA